MIEPVADSFWSGLSHVADVLGVVAFLLAIVALVITLRQLDRTQSAVEAADEAARRAERDSALRQILTVLPNMEQISEALDSAVREAQVEIARRELVSWRTRGSETLGILALRTDLPPSLRTKLTKSIAQAGAAKARLVEENEVDIAKVTERARREIAQSVTELSELAGRLKSYPSEEQDHD